MMQQDVALLQVPGMRFAERTVGATLEIRCTALRIQSISAATATALGGGVD